MRSAIASFALIPSAAYAAAISRAEIVRAIGALFATAPTRYARCRSLTLTTRPSRRRSAFVAGLTRSLHVHVIGFVSLSGSKHRCTSILFILALSTAAKVASCSTYIVTIVLVTFGPTYILEPIFSSSLPTYILAVLFASRLGLYLYCGHQFVRIGPRIYRTPQKAFNLAFAPYY